MTTPQEIARLFIEAINDRDLDRMKELLDVDHRFTDSLGSSVEGREPVLTAWRTYFGWRPDYRIDIEEILVQGPRVAMFGAGAPSLPTVRSTRRTDGSFPPPGSSG